jgi:ribosomal protein S18 acetylase RimI-like enzyme
MIEIRILSADDYDAICGVWAASGVHYQTTGRESRESFAKQMASDIQTVLGAIDTEDGDRLIGVAIATHDGRKGWISRLGVLPDRQREGIGTRLIRAADELLHEKGLTIVAALVEHWNEASLGLFKSQGFLVNDTYYLSKRDHPNA